MSEIARLSVEIDDVTPRVVRLVEVPADIRLDDLHFVLQIAIGWQNGHPFEFRVGEKLWGQPDRDAGIDRMPAEQSTLRDILAAGDTFKYDYVFGEDWQHTVTVQSREAAQPGLRYPNLISAEGRCPPADIGGPMGYETFLRAIADPEHLHHEGMIEWDDPDFDPHVVDETAIRANLANLGKYLGRRKADQH